MSSSCINLSHPAYQKLFAECGLPREVFNAKLSIWLEEAQKQGAPETWFPSKNHILDAIDPLLKEKYFKNEDVVPMSVILDKIIASKHPLASLAEYLKQYVRYDYQVRLSPSAFYQMNNGVRAAALANIYKEGQDGYEDLAPLSEIVIHQYASFRSIGWGAEAIILHEIIHALSVNAINNRKSKATNEFNALFDELKAKNYASLRDEYAMTDADEFIVALFTDEKFINKLTQIPSSVLRGRYTHPNKLMEIIEKLLNLLNIQRTDKVYHIAAHLATIVLHQQADFASERIRENSISSSPQGVFEQSPFSFSSPILKPIIIKPGVEELFDSNPELANQVYETLGLQSMSLEDSTKKVNNLQSNSVGAGDKPMYHGDYLYVQAQPVRGKNYLYYKRDNNDWVEINKQEAIQLIIDKSISPQQKQQALQLYSQYLDGIFPDSKVKDIKWHGSKQQIDTFDSSFNARGGVGFWFGAFAQPNVLYKSDDYVKPYGDFNIPVILNIQNQIVLPNKEVTGKIQDTEFSIMGNNLSEVKKLGYDSITNDTLTESQKEEIKSNPKKYQIYETVVFEPEQIHKLGSKQDIEGFKEFVNNKKYVTSSSITPPIIEEDFSTQIKSNIYELEEGITEEKIKSIYDNYVKLMDRARVGKSMPYTSFKSLLSKYQVFKYKDTYIFGQYDIKNAVFVTRVNSSPSSKELLSEAIPKLVETGLDFISFVPLDYAKKLERSGYQISTNSYSYDFKGEDMLKYAATSNPNVSIKIFGKPIDEVSAKEISDYSEEASLERVPVSIEGELIKQAGNDINKILETYLRQFGIIVKDVQDSLGLTEESFADVLSKIAYIKEGKDLPKIAGEFIAFMMQQNPLVKDIVFSLYNEKVYGNESYASFKNTYSKLDKTEYFKEIGKLITEALEGRLSTKHSLYDKIKELIKKFFKLLSKTDFKLIDKNIGEIVNNILQQNKDLITSSKFKPGAIGNKTKQVSIEEALSKDPFGAIIIEKMAKIGMVLTGSTALSEQGTILRPDENMLHDIDFCSPYLYKETISKFLEVYPEAVKIRAIINPEYRTDSFIIAPEGYKVVNLPLVQYGDKIMVQYYDVADNENNIVGNYTLEKKNGKNVEVVTGIEAKTIDFFSKTMQEESPAVPYVTKEGSTILLSNWRDIFRAKIEFARYKDIWDYNRFIPKENMEYNAMFSLKVKMTAKNLLQELVDKGVVIFYKGYYLIKKGLDQKDFHSNQQAFLRLNKVISERLGLYPKMIFSLKKTTSTFEVIVNEHLLPNTIDNVIENARSTNENFKDTKELLDVMEHFQKIFPGIKIKKISRENLRKRFPNKSEKELDSINAFFDKESNTIRIADAQKVTVAALVEEFLHPFINTIAGTPLYKTLLKEALEKAQLGGEFESLYEDVMSTYAKAYNNDKELLEREFLTQAISKVFSKDLSIKDRFYAGVKRFKEKILKLLNDLGLTDFKQIEQLDSLTIGQLVTLLQYEDFRYDVLSEPLNSKSTPDDVWFSIKSNINKDIAASLASKPISDLREKYQEFFKKTNGKLRALIMSEKDKGGAIASAAFESSLLKQLEENPIGMEQVVDNTITYYDGVCNTLFGLEKGFINAKNLKIENLHNIIYKIYNAAIAMEEDIDSFGRELQGVDAETNPLVKKVEEARKSLNAIKQAYIDYSINPIAEALAKTMAISNANTIEEANRNIKKAKETMAGLPNKTSYVYRKQLKIVKENEDILKNLTPSVENLKKDLSGANAKNFEDVSWYRANLLAALDGGNMSVTAVAKFIDDVQDKGLNNALRFLPRIMKLKEKFLAKHPDLNLAKIDSMFKKFTKVVDIHQITKEGEHNTTEDVDWVVLLSPMDHYKFNNDLMALEEKLKGSLTESEREDVERQRKELIEGYAENQYTEHYFKILETLLPETKRERDRLIDTINHLNSMKEVGKFFTEDNEQELKDAIKEYLRLDSEYNEFGDLKDEEGVRIAKNLKEFKKLRKDLDVLEFHISDFNKEKWKIEKKKIDDDYNSGVITQDVRDKWYEENVRTTYKPGYYKLMDTLWKDINNILQQIPESVYEEEELEGLSPEIKDIILSLKDKKDALKERREKIQDLIKGYKDNNGYVKAQEMSRDLIAQTKEIEVEMDEIKKFIIKATGLSALEFNTLSNLKGSLYKYAAGSEEFEQITTDIAFLENKRDKNALPDVLVTQLEQLFMLLEQLTVTLPSPYFYIERQKQKDIIKYFHPSYTDEEVEEALRATPWFLDNHILRTMYEKIDDDNAPKGYFMRAYQSYDPLYVWKKSVPVEEDFINAEEPTNLWGNYRVKDEILKEDVTKHDKEKIDEDFKSGKITLEEKNKWYEENTLPIKNKNYRAVDGKLTPRENGITDKYVNKEYNTTLTPTEKEFLKEYTELYFELQRENVPVNQRNGWKIPQRRRGLYDDGILEAMLRLPSRMWYSFLSLFNNTKEVLGFKTTGRGEEDNEDINRKKNKSKVYLKYTSRIEPNEVNLNLFDSLGVYAAESFVHKATSDNLDVVLTARTLYSSKRANTKLAKQIENFIDMRVYNEFDIRKPSVLTKLFSSSTGYASLLMMAGRPLQDLKNVSTATLFNLMYADNVYFSKNDYRKSLADTTRMVFSAAYHDKMNIADKSLFGMQVDYFRFIQGDLRSMIGKGFLNDLAKGIISREMLFYGRETGELIVQASLGRAISKNFKVMLNGKLVPILDAYERGEGTLKLKPGAYTDDKGNTLSTEEIEAIENQYKSIVAKFNRDANGNYSKNTKVNLEREWVGKIFLFMQRYFFNFFSERYGGKRMDYMTGQMKIGIYRQFYGMFADIARSPKEFSLDNYSDSNIQRATIALLEHVGWLGLMFLTFILRSLLEDEDDDDLKGLIGWNILNLITQTNTELATFNPLDAAWDYYPTRTTKKDGKVWDLKAKWEMFNKRMVLRRLYSSIYPIQHVYMPIAQDALNYMDGNPYAKYSGKGNQKDKKGDLKLLHSIQKLVPLKGMKDISNPKAYQEAFIYFNGR